MRTESSKDGRVMGCLAIFVGAVVGAILGICAGFFLPEPILSVVNPQAISDGQWSILLLTTIPAGCAIGAFIGGLSGFLMARRH